MLVMKFGGSSLADAEALARVATIIEGRRDRQPLVVVSAHRGVTDQLHAVAQAARHGGLEAALPGLEENGGNSLGSVRRCKSCCGKAISMPSAMKHL